MAVFSASVSNAPGGNVIAVSLALTLSCCFTEEASVKKIVLALVVAVAAAAAANAQTPAKAAAPKAQQTKATPAAGAPAMKPAKAAAVKVEVVSTDAAAKTITVKDSSGSNETLTATGAAVAALAKVKAGDWVMVTKSDTNATKIMKVKASGAAKAKK